MNKVVAHYQSGKVVKGTTVDFVPAKDHFHLLQGGVDSPMEIRGPDLKALFFVKDLVGDGRFRKSNDFTPWDRTPGRKIRIRFRDGEVLQGFTWGYQVGRSGFFVIPADKNSNNERCYVVTSATTEVTFL